MVLGCAVALLLIACARPLLGQGFEVQSKSAPSVIGAGKFVSLEGRFSIALPQTNHAFSGTSLETSAGRVEWTIFEVRDGTVESKHSYAYEFDAKGNWITRTSSKWVTKHGRSYYEPENVYYRKITYY
jgi:hypothetical protein